MTIATVRATDRATVRVTTLAAGLLGSGVAAAHPGEHAVHAAAAAVLHLLASPDHLLVLLAAAAVAMLGLRLLRAQRQRR